MSFILVGGNEAGDFMIGSTSGLVTVSTGATLNATNTNAYALIIEAYDNGIPPKTGTTTLIVAVCSGAFANTLGTVLFVLIMSFSCFV